MPVFSSRLHLHGNIIGFHQRGYDGVVTDIEGLTTNTRVHEAGTRSEAACQVPQWMTSLVKTISDEDRKIESD